MTVSPNVYFNVTERDNRLTLLPIHRHDLWEAYQKAVAAFWTVGEVTLSEDRRDFQEKLTESQRHFLKYILAFFATSDSIVNINLLQRFQVDAQDIPEAQCFYNFQAAMENIHAEMYARLIDTLIDDEDEKQSLFDAIHNIPAIKAMADWMFRCISSEASIAERLLRMACVEGIFFTGCFCAIYWFQEQGLMPGLAQSNEFIARDEGLHTQFAMLMYNQGKPEYRLSTEEFHRILRDAVDIAVEFCNSALPDDMVGMNARLMTEYIRCQADNLALMADVEPPYRATQPFAFMEKLNQTNKTNFFLRRVTEYSGPSRADTSNFAMVDDF